MKTTTIKIYKITTTKIYDGSYMASSRAAMSGVHGFGKTRSAAIADLRRQMRHPV